MKTCSVQLDRSLRTSHSVVIQVVSSGAAVLVCVRPYPSLGFILLLAIALGGTGIAAALCAEGLLVGAGKPRWPAYLSMAVFWLFFSGIAVASLIIPTRNEVKRGDFLRLERTTGRVTLPRSGRQLSGSHVRGILLATGVTEDSGWDSEPYRFTELFLVVDEGSQEEHVPVVLWAGSSMQLRSIGRQLAAEIGVPFREARIPTENMPTSAEIRRDVARGKW